MSTALFVVVLGLSGVLLIINVLACLGRFSRALKFRRRHYTFSGSFFLCNTLPSLWGLCTFPLRLHFRSAVPQDFALRS